MKKSILIIAAMTLIACGKKPAADTPSTTAAAAPSGETLFTEKGCVACHGAQGKGDGPAGASLNPKPRNFSDAKWKLGFDLPTVINTIKNGVPNSPMVGYKDSMSEAEVKILAEHVRKLGGKT